MKFISIWLVDPKRLAQAPSEDEMARMGELIGEFMSKGVLVDTGGVMSTAGGTRVRRAGERVMVTDGPFAEAKEVVGGYALFNVKSKEEALELTRRFVEVAGDGVAELHQLAEY